MRSSSTQDGQREVNCHVVGKFSVPPMVEKAPGARYRTGRLHCGIVVGTHALIHRLRVTQPFA